MIQKLKNAHPAITLKLAYEYAEKVNKKFQEPAVFDRPSLLNALGYERRTGSAQNAISALEHFSLIRKVEEGYFIPESTRTLFSVKPKTQEWKDILASLALKPVLYKYIYGKYGLEIPTDLPEKLVKKFGDRNIKESNVQAIINNYFESLAFAGFSIDTKKLKFAISSKDENDVKIEISVDGEPMAILHKYLLEAYQKTLQYDLKKVQNQLKNLR